MSENIQTTFGELFGLLTVMDVYVYKFTDAAKANGVTYADVFNIRNLEYTGLCLNTLTVSTINNSKIKQEFKSGKFGIPSARNGQDIKITITDSLIRTKALKLFGGIKEYGQPTEELLYLDVNAPEPFALRGKLRVESIQGHVTYIDVIFPYFVPDSNFDLSFGDGGTLNLSGQLYPVSLPNTKSLVYYYFDTGWLHEPPTSSTYLEEALDMFSIINVMDVHVYTITKHEGNSIPVKHDTNLILNTMKLSKITVSAPTHNFIAGRIGAKTFRHGRQVQIQIQDALCNADVLQYFYNIQHVNNTDVYTVTNVPASSLWLEGTASILDVFGKKQQITVTLPCFIPKSIININLSSSNNVAVFDLQGTLYPVYTEFNSTPTYFWLNSGDNPDPVWDYVFDNDNLYAYIADNTMDEYSTPSFRNNTTITKIIRDTTNIPVNRSATKVYINTPCELSCFVNFMALQEIIIGDNLNIEDVNISVFDNCPITSMTSSYDFICNYGQNSPEFAEKIKAITITKGDIDPLQLMSYFPNLTHITITKDAKVLQWFDFNCFKENRHNITINIHDDSTLYMQKNYIIYDKTTYNALYCTMYNADITIYEKCRQMNNGIFYGRNIHLTLPNIVNNIAKLLEPDPSASYNAFTLKSTLATLRCNSMQMFIDTDNYVRETYTTTFASWANINNLYLSNPNANIQDITIDWSMFISTNLHILYLDIDTNQTNSYSCINLDSFISEQQLDTIFCTLGSYFTQDNLLYHSDTSGSVCLIYSANHSTVRISNVCNKIQNKAFYQNTKMQTLYINSVIDIEDGAMDSIRPKSNILKAISVSTQMPLVASKFKNRSLVELEILCYPDIKTWCMSYYNTKKGTTEINDDTLNILTQAPKCVLYLGSLDSEYQMAYYAWINYNKFVAYIPCNTFQNTNINNITTIDLSHAQRYGSALLYNCDMPQLTELRLSTLPKGEVTTTTQTIEITTTINDNGIITTNTETLPETTFISSMPAGTTTTTTTTTENNTTIETKTTLKTVKSSTQVFGCLWQRNPKNDTKDSAINYCVPSTITKVVFTECVTIDSWSSGAFRGCKYLEYCLFEMGVKMLPANCFRACTNLKIFYIDWLLQTISPNAFHNCPSVAFVTSDQVANEDWNIYNTDDLAEIHSRHLSCFINSTTNNKMEPQVVHSQYFSIWDRHFITDVVIDWDDYENPISEDVLLYCAAGFKANDVVILPDMHIGNGKCSLQTFCLSGIALLELIIPTYIRRIGTGQYNDKTYIGKGILEYSQIKHLQFGVNKSDKYYSNNCTEFTSIDHIDRDALANFTTKDDSPVEMYCTRDLYDLISNMSEKPIFGYKGTEQISYKPS